MDSRDQGVIEYFISINKDAWNSTHLNKAISNEDLENAWFLATKGPGYNREQLIQLLFLTVKVNDLVKFNSLYRANLKLKDPIDFNKINDSSGNTLLGLIAEHRRHAMARLLIPKDATQITPSIPSTIPSIKAHLFDSQGMTPLHRAANNGDLKMADILLQHMKATQEIKTALDQVKTPCLRTPLFMAATAGHLDMVELLLTWKASLDCSFLNLISLMTTVLQCKQLKVAYFLLKKGISVSSDEMLDLLCLALEANNVQMINDLLEFHVGKLDLNQISPQVNTTPLILATRHGNIQAVQSLLKLKAEVNFTLKTKSLLQQKTVLNDVQKAIIQEISIDSTLKEGVNDLRNFEASALHAAAAHGRGAIAQCLMASGAKLHNMAEDGTTALMLAAARGKLDLLKQLLNANEKQAREEADILNYQRSLDGKTALFLASEYNKIDVVQFLLSKKANPLLVSKENETALSMALKKGHLECVAAFYEHGTPFNDKELSDLFCLATQQNKPTLLRKILSDKKNNALINQCGTTGWTPLNLAIYFGHPNIISLLSVYGVNWLKADQQGYTPFHVAVEMNDLDLVKELLEKKYPKLKKSLLNLMIPSTKMTPLALAVKQGFFNMTEYLLSHKLINLETQNQRKATPLFIAVEKGHFEIAKLLLEHKANPNVEAIFDNGLPMRDHDSPFSISIAALSHYSAYLLLILYKHGATFGPGEHGLTTFYQIRDLFVPKYQPASKQLHLIWVGCNIPEKYFFTLMKLLVLAQKSGFKVNLWLENPLNYYRPLSKLQILTPGLRFPGLRLRNLMKLKQGMKNDPFYLQMFRKGVSKLRFFDTYMLREMCGLKNPAAVSDVYRLEILRQEGGVYFDFDTEFHIGAEDRLNDLFMKEAFGIHLGQKVQEVFHEGKHVRGGLNIYTNDFMAFTPHHPIVTKTIAEIFKQFDKLDHVTELSQHYCPALSITHFASNLMDAKRAYIKQRSHRVDMNPSKDGKHIHAIQGVDRRSLTLETSCNPLRIISEDYCKQESPLITGGFPYILNRFNHNVKKSYFDAQVLGIRVAHGSDQTWIKSPTGLPTSFDDSLLYSPSIRGLLGKKK